jgi:ABC-type phosphate transport system substrate-binding protein
VSFSDIDCTAYFLETYVAFLVTFLFQGLSIYEIKCNVTFTLEGGGSSIGAKRVCGSTDVGSDVDIGNLSREWKQTEAVERDDDAYLYDCVIGKNNKSAIQIPVALDGLTVVTLYDGAANNCIQILGGLSTDQLRWIYSNYTEDQLKNTGWDPTSIRNNNAVLRTPTSINNSDAVRRTRHWSEIDGRCRNEEIQISGPGGEVSRGTGNNDDNGF